METRVSYLLDVNHGAPLSMEAKRFSKCSEYGSIGDVFRVDDLLDFSNEEIAGITSEDSAKDGLQLSNLPADYSVTVAEKVSGGLATNCAQPPNTLNQDEITTDLCVRCDDIAELEWLSTFVEDSFSGAADFKVLGSLCASSQKCTEQSTKKDDSSSSSSSASESLSNHSQDMSVPGRARSKRSRAGVRVWSSRMLTSPTCSAFQTATPSFLSFNGPSLSAETEFIATTELLCGTGPFPANKFTKFCKRKVWQDGSQPRRCTHCLTQRTPQWRAGPMGPKTLCNACGVRFKSGKLFPEYRPAGSPTFLSHEHSNSHRKVLEMRRQKEASEQQEERQSDEVVTLRHPIVLEFEGQIPSLHDASFRNSEECTAQKDRS